MSKKINLSELVTQIVNVAYPELRQSEIQVQWLKIGSFATVSWDNDSKNIKIKCNSITESWPDAALIGLLSHELSHPSLKATKNTERNTDLDAIERGFAPYLCIERLFAGKYEDHILKKGKDRYLGYRAIRQLLTPVESKHLKKLLTELRLIPEKKKSERTLYHDITIIHSKEDTTIRVDGHDFIVEPMNSDPEVKTLQNGELTYIIINGKERGSFPNPAD